MDPSAQGTSRDLELWGGIECSVVRLGDRLENQIARTGHDRRSGDLELFAGLGLKAMRYPILWELHAKEPVDWSWADERLNRLRELGIRPIVGLLHHGSGPLAGALLDQEFVTGLARFARQVAERYPWIDAYTPVNEPLTTARFSGMYDVWYPHAQSVPAFVRALLNQCLGIRAAMAAIREVNPHAQLIQTEDLGKTHSTPRLAYQAAFENERRWITYDLLCGQMSPDCLLWPYLCNGGATPAELESFREEPCPPDVMGFNYYVTSERFLDERLQRYPSELVGGNDRERYADLCAVRVRGEGLSGPALLLAEAWRRFQRPMAITELQLACTREEQVRWLVDVWEAVEHARSAGIDVRALTVWALLGAYDWDSLLVHANGNYECGAFDSRSPVPRATTVARTVAALARGEKPSHPILSSPGWWRRRVRLEYPAVSSPGFGGALAQDVLPNRPILVVGAGGRLTRTLRDWCHIRGLALEVHPWDDAVLYGPEVRNLIERAWAVIDATVEAELDSLEVGAIPTAAAEPGPSANLAQLCAELSRPLLVFSSAHVFGQPAREPGHGWRETDRPQPGDALGARLLAREASIHAAHPEALLVRAGEWYALSDGDFTHRVLTALHNHQTLTLPHPAEISPSHLADVVNLALDLLVDGETGLWHLGGAGVATYSRWAQTLAEAAGYLPDRLQLRSAAPAASPDATICRALDSIHGPLLLPWANALQRWLNKRDLRRTQPLARVA